MSTKETENKKDPTDIIKNHKIGNEDLSGSKIINIISKREQFVIYEIDTPIVQNRIRVVIDSNDKNLEKEIIEKYNLVKSRYIKAKSEIFHNDDYESNKNLIAHTLAAYLDDHRDKTDKGNEFDKIINMIYEKNKTILYNKMYFMFPFLLFLIIGFCLHLTFTPGTNEASTELYIFISSLVGASLGGTLSIGTSLKNRNFQEFNSSWLFLANGILHFFIIFATSLIFLIILKSEVISISFINNDNIWSIITAAIFSGFSERLIPNLLSNTENKISSINS